MLTLKPFPVGRNTREPGENPFWEATGGTQPITFHAAVTCFVCWALSTLICCSPKQQ